MDYKIFVTVGTSIITNGKIANFENFDDSSYYEHWDEKIFERQKNNWLQSINKQLDKQSLSAEISSLHKIHEELPTGTSYDVYLLCTDTLNSAVCAWVIQQWFNENKTKHNKYEKFSNILFEFNDQHIARDLRISTQTNYNKGFMALIGILEANKPTEGDILNITGGYKAIIPILTIYGQLRKMPLKYTYNEAELENAPLVTVGNLPISFDWAAVEALKPFLAEHALKSLQSDEIINSLKAYGLIAQQESGYIRSTLGQMLHGHKIPIESNKGHIMEHLLFRYFALPHDNNEHTKHYSVTPTFPNSDNPYRLDGEKIELGDIDVPLIYQSDAEMHYVWCEVKTISSATDYSADDKGPKYYKQLKARALALSEKEQPVEILFIIFRFVVSGVNDKEAFIHEKLKPAIAYLQSLNDDEAFSRRAKFKCLGVTIPVSFKENKINMTKGFYRGDFSTWIWERLDASKLTG